MVLELVNLFHVAENSVNGTVLGHVTVSDADTGENGRVDCQLLHHNRVRDYTRQRGRLIYTTY